MRLGLVLLGIVDRRCMTSSICWLTVLPTSCLLLLWRLCCSSCPGSFRDCLVGLGIITVATLVIILNKSGENLTY